MRMAFSTAAALVASLLFVPSAPLHAQGEVDAADESMRRQMTFFMTRSGDYLALAQSDEQNHVFYGSSRHLYRQRVLMTAVDDEEDLDILIWSPGQVRDASLSSNGDEWTLRCGEARETVTRVAADEREVLATAARFHEQKFTRVPYTLARNDKGEYFYVDRDAKAADGEGFEFFIGRTGKAKKQRLEWVVSDSEGDVFATRRGELRIGRGEDRAPGIVWRSGKAAPIELLAVPIGQNGQLIYTQLGVYKNERFGTPCDSTPDSSL